MIKYKTTAGSVEIQSVEVERETDHSVWIRGFREAKSSSFSRYWNSWEGAHSYLVDRALGALEMYRRRLCSAETEYLKVESMKPPTTK